jgi:hypothetical protein
MLDNKKENWTQNRLLALLSYLAQGRRGGMGLVGWSVLDSATSRGLLCLK